MTKRAKSKTAKLYMCGTDYQHEMGEVTVKMYASIESLKADRPCVRECGIVAVKVELVEWVDHGLPYSERGTPITEFDRENNNEKGSEE